MNLIKKISSTLIATVLGATFISNVYATSTDFGLLEITSQNQNTVRIHYDVDYFAYAPYETLPLWTWNTNQQYDSTATRGRKILAATIDKTSFTIDQKYYNLYSIVKDANKKCFITSPSYDHLFSASKKGQLTEICIPMSNDKQANQTVGLVYDGNHFIEQEYSPKNNVSYLRKYKTWKQLIARKPYGTSILKNNFNKENIYHGIAYEKSSRGQGYYTILCKVNGNFFIIAGRNTNELQQFSQQVENRIKEGKQKFIYLDKSKGFKIFSILTNKIGM